MGVKEKANVKSNVKGAVLSAGFAVMAALQDNVLTLGEVADIGRDMLAETGLENLTLVDMTDAGNGEAG